MTMPIGRPTLLSRCASIVSIGLLLGACAHGAPGPDPVVVKRAQMQMGTIVTLTAVASDEATGQRALTAGFQEVRRLEQLLSTWIPASELSQVNRAAGQAPVTVSDETWTVVSRSLEIAALTDGAFNIAVGPAVEAWSVTERQRIPDEAELERLRPAIDLRQVQLDRQARTIYLARPEMRLDVGGIGKGYAADRVEVVMRQAGALGGVVALAGDIKTFGRLPGGKPFPFAIRHPRKPDEVLAFVDLQDEAISTAGDYERFFERDGVRYHHILDPRTLQPARACQSVTVVAKEGVMADGLDTGIFVLGPERGMALVERLPDVEAVIVDDTGRVLVSSGLQGRVRFP